MKFITHIKEPDCLYLTWQPSIRSGKHRMRRIVARLVRTADGDAALEYCTGTDDFNAAVGDGFTGYPAFLTGKRQV